MTLNHESKYTSRRTFVLKLRSDATHDALAGCLENIVSNRQRSFESARELIEALTHELTLCGTEPLEPKN